MQEEYLHYIWKNQLFSLNLKTTDDKDIHIEKNGTPNMDSGPDFSEAVIKIGDTLWAGNIEIHIRSSDWFKHNHHKDDAYKSVILHVVFQDDLSKEQLNIPTLIIRKYIRLDHYHKYLSFMSNMTWIPCETQIKNVHQFKIYSFLSGLTIDRIHNKTDYILSILNELNNDIDECLYIQLAKSFGFKTNSSAFEQLARNLPLKILIKYRKNLFQIEALLFGQAGLLQLPYKEVYPVKLKKEYNYLRKKHGLLPNSNHNWKFLRLRPHNFPSIRIAQFAVLIYKSSVSMSSIIDCESISQLNNLFQIEPNEYWNNHSHFDKMAKKSLKALGKQSRNLIIINAVIPFLFIYGKNFNKEYLCKRAIHLLEVMEGENNHIIRKWKKLGIISSSAYFTQALIHLKTEFCDKKRCLECQIGHELIGNDECRMIR